MRVQVVSAFCLGQGRDVLEGEILELEDKEARVKITQGFVRPLPAETEEQTGLGASGVEVEHSEPEVEVRDPRPRGRRGR